MFTSPAWCCLAGVSLTNLFNYWVIYTAEDRDFRRNGNRGYREGLPSVGRHLKTEMEQIPDPDTARQLHPDWVTVHFPDREWVFGYGIDSHGFQVGRGTLVVKDSRGRARVFFGHICGQNGVGVFMKSSYVKTLDEFYRDLQVGDVLREWVPDQ